MTTWLTALSLYDGSGVTFFDGLSQISEYKVTNYKFVIIIIVVVVKFCLFVFGHFQFSLSKVSLTLY